MRKNRRLGISPVISSVIMIVATIVCMTAVVAWSQGSIYDYHNLMGERIAVEKVIVTPNGSTVIIKVYVRNIGQTQVTLSYAIINTKMYNFAQGKTVISTQGQWLTIQNCAVASLHYLIVLVSTRNNQFNTEGLNA